TDQHEDEGDTSGSHGLLPSLPGRPADGRRAPILLPLFSVNQTLLSRPQTMPLKSLSGVGTGYSVMAAPVVIRPIWLPVSSTNHRLPSGPEAMAIGSLLGVGMGYSVMAPSVVIRPILLAEKPDSVNQRLPSRPEVMPVGMLLGVGMGYSV